MLKLPRLFGNREKYPQKFLGLDIGSKVVKLALFELKGSEAYVLACKTKELGQGLDAKDGLKDILDELKVEFGQFPKDAVVGVWGPRVKAFTTVVRGKPGLKVEKLINHARDAALAEAERELTSFWGVREEIVELEAEVLEINDDSDGNDGAEIFLFTSFALRSYLDNLQKVLKPLNLEIFSFSFLPFNLTSVFRPEPSDLTNAEDLNAFLVDIGASGVDISLVFGGEIIDTYSFMWNLLEAPKNPPLFMELFLNSLETAMGEFTASAKIFPSLLILSGGGSLLPDIEMQMESFPWSRRLPFEAPPQIKVLSKDMLSLVRSEGLDVKSPDIPLLSLAHAGLRFKEVRG